MPVMAASVAELMSLFGEAVDEAVASGKRGEPAVFTAENGRTIGARAGIT
jgi:hypothetical protein